MNPRRIASFGLSVGLAAIALTLTACSAEPAPSPSASVTSLEPSATPSVSASPSPSPTAIVLEGAATAHVAGRVTIKNGLDLPWDIAWTSDTTMLVTLRDKAQIWWYKSGESDYLVGEGADWLVANVDNTGEGGLLGLAVLPSDPSFLYVYATTQSYNEVVRMTLSGQTLTDPTVIVTGIVKNSYHDGGRIRFGPDGYLYITSGDAGHTELSQNLDSLNGKILRAVANGTVEDGTVPPDNPFGTLVWSYGHRNPQGIGWAADGRMFASELGQNALDELNLIEPGQNYGWPIKEAIIGAPQGAQPGQTIDGYTYPLAWWATSEASPSGIAVTDEAVYVAALRGQRVWRVPLTPDGVGIPHVLLNDLGRIRAVNQGPNGNLYLLTSNTTGTGQGVGIDQLITFRVVEDSA